MRRAPDVLVTSQAHASRLAKGEACGHCAPHRIIAGVSGEHILQRLSAEAPALVIGVALVTIAIALVAFALLAAAASQRPLLFAGAFAGFYGLRLIFNTSTYGMAIGVAPMLPYIRSALEYIVPIPATALFANVFGGRVRRLNAAAVPLSIAIALIAIPYEIATHQPYAFQTVVNAFVMLVMPLFAFNLFATEKREWRLVRWGALVFVIFVINEHLRLVGSGGLEPFGFVIFIGSFVLTLMRQAVSTQVRLGAVESELATARTIQMSILPREHPRVNRLDIATVYTPATEVAGDFYDFIRVDEDHLGTLVADVSGHGVPAALVASMLKVALASQSAHAAEPSELLAQLNALFHGKLQRQFITAAYAFVDATSGVVRLASAGHPPPLVRRANGEVEELLASGVILGRFAAVRCEEITTTLGPGDALVLYTDGVTEAMDEREELFGEERLRDVISRVRGSAEDVAQAIEAALARWRRPDDVTIVVITFAQTNVK
jgi:sigma-B regulation protein RsbU (phosphoserine phosphatase)